MSKVEVYLKMKNASAEGVYDFTDDNILVKAGAIIENPVAEGFKNHNYANLRTKLINEGYVDDYILTKDYSFNSLSAAAAVIGGRAAAGPLEWRNKEGKTVKVSKY